LPPLGRFPALSHQLPETVEIDETGVHVEAVSADGRHPVQAVVEASLVQCGADPAGQGVQIRAAVQLYPIIPEVFDYRVYPNGLADMIEQHRKHATLLGRAELNLTLTDS